MSSPVSNADTRTGLLNGIIPTKTPLNIKIKKYKTLL